MTETEQVLIKAIELERRVRIIYEKDGEFTERTVRPKRLENGELSAYCYMRRSVRRFRVSGILSAIIINED